MTVSDNSEVVREKLLTEMAQGRIAGPFDFAPFPNFKSSPLSLRSKPEPGKFRLLHNLSYPYDHTSVNFNIPESFSKVTYASISDAISLMNVCGPAAFLAKLDIKDAFKIIPLHPSQYNLTGFSFGGKYFYDRTLPMGCSSSCRIFEAFSTSLQWIVNSRSRTLQTVKVLDDFLFVGRTYSECDNLLQTLLFVCSTLGVPIAENKTVRPTHKLTFLGIELDASAMTAALPSDKLTRYRTALQHATAVPSMSLTDLKSVIGKLQFATSVVNGGRPFLRRLYNLTIGVPRHGRIYLGSGARADLETWRVFLNCFNGKSIVRDHPSCCSLSLNLYSDASTLAFGGTYGRSWIQHLWPAQWKTYNIAVLEFFAILVLVSVFAPKLVNSNILIFCDNKAVVDIINNQTSKHTQLLAILRSFVLLLLRHNIALIARHIPGARNILSDKLSRLQVTPETLKQYGMKHSATPIPTHLLPEHFNLPCPPSYTPP